MKSVANCRNTAVLLFLISVFTNCLCAGTVFNDSNSWTAYQAPDANGFNSGVFDGRYLYFAPYCNADGYHGRVARFDTNGNLENANSWQTYDAGENGTGTDPDGYAGAIFDGTYIYFVPHYNGTKYHGEVLRYDTNSTFQNADSWTSYDPGANGVGSDPDGYVGGVFDGRYIYLAPYFNGTDYHGEVLRYDTTADFEQVGSWQSYDPGHDDVGTDPEGYWGAAFDDRYIYFAPLHNQMEAHGEVLRYDTNAVFTNSSSWSTFDPGENEVGNDADGYNGVVCDGRYLYFVPYHNGTEYHGEVLQYDSNAPFDNAASWKTFDAGAKGIGNDADGYDGAVYDGSHVYFVPYYNGTNHHGEVLRYDANHLFTDPNSWNAFDAGANGVGDDPDGYAGGLFDGKSVYFIPLYNGSDYHSEVLRYRPYYCGDIEKDGDVDFVDFAMFAEWWQRQDCGQCGGADCTGDGNVEFDDLAKFAKNWLEGK